MATVQPTFVELRIRQTCILVGFFGVLLVHVLAFASVFFQLLWIVPVYADRFGNAVRPLPGLTYYAIGFASLFERIPFQLLFMGLLAVDLAILGLLYFRPRGSVFAFTLYSHSVLACLFAYFVWNSLSLCIGIAAYA